MVEMPQSTALMTRPTAVETDVPVTPSRRLPAAALVDRAPLGL